MKIFFKKLAMLLVLVLIFSPLLSSLSYAGGYLNGYSTTSALQTSYELSDDYHRISTPYDEPNRIYLRGKVKDPNIKILCLRITKVSDNPAEAKNVITQMIRPNEDGQYSMRIDTTEGNTELPVAYKGTLIDASNPDGCAEIKPGNPYEPMEKLDSGKYRLRITASTEEVDYTRGSEWWTGILGGSKGYVWSEALLRSLGDDNGLRCIKYPNVMAHNSYLRWLYRKHDYNLNSYKGSYVRYRDSRMRSPNIDWIFVNPVTEEYEQLTSSQADYLKTVSNEITDGANSDYEKLLKIYEFAANNFYYDYYAWQQWKENRKKQYVNPYRNIYNLRNNVESENSHDGKVSTVCDGYAAIVVSLARAQGIPARIVNGRHLSGNANIWSTIPSYNIKDPKKTNHWWAEAYVDNRWIVIDANLGTLNKWHRDSFEDPGE